MLPSSLRTFCLSLIAAGVLASACADPECPDGYDKVGKVCRRTDAGSFVLAGDGGAAAGDATVNATDRGSEAGTDAATRVDASALEASTDASPPTAGMDAGGAGGNAAVDAAAALADAASVDAATADAAPPPECDTSHPSAAGTVCSGAKCVSACTQTQCDPNATCSLIANAPVCSCNGGFASMKGADGSVTCIRDLNCEQLGCDAQNGECLGNTAQTRHCACKNGYTGDGKTCTPVSCPTPTLANGVVATFDGLTLGKTATFQCNAGYDFPLMVPTVTRTCGPDKTWGAAVPACSPKNCGPLSVPYGTADTSRGTTFGSPAVAVTCRNGFVRYGSASVDCQADGKWATPPSCLGCGDKQVSKIAGVLQEQCDPTAPDWNDWNCTASCTTTTAYLRCSSEETRCTGADEQCYLGFCQPRCDANSICPPIPASSRAKAVCLSAGDYCTVQYCKTFADCAPGLRCYYGGNITPYCIPCSPSDDCL